VIGLRVIRHEEFVGGCEATCNGPYGGDWSKTMIGYGPETENFVLELIYNYGITHYTPGDDLQYIALAAPSLIPRAKALGYPVNEEKQVITGPDGYNFKILNAIPGRAERFVALALKVSSLKNALGYWVGVLGMTEYPTPAGLETTSPSATVAFGPE